MNCSSSDQSVIAKTTSSNAPLNGPFSASRKMRAIISESRPKAPQPHAPRGSRSRPRPGPLPQREFERCRNARCGGFQRERGTPQLSYGRDSVNELGSSRLARSSATTLHVLGAQRMSARGAIPPAPMGPMISNAPIRVPGLTASASGMDAADYIRAIHFNVISQTSDSAAL